MGNRHMNQTDLTKLTESLKKCGIETNEPLIKKFNEFVKYQKLNDKIDGMINQANESKISDNEFKGMIDEQKEIMKQLGIRDIDFEETPELIKLPEILNTRNSNTRNSNTRNSNTRNSNTRNSNTRNLNTRNSNTRNSNSYKSNKKINIKIFNLNEITNYEVDNNKYYFYGNNQEPVNKVRLIDNRIIKIDQLSLEQQEDLSDDIDLKNTKGQNTKGQNTKGQNTKGQNTKLKSRKIKKLQKINGKKKKYSKVKSNRHIYHKIPLYARNNYIERPIGLKKRRKTKRINTKIIKDIPEVNSRGSRVPFRGFMDFFKLS